MARYKLFCECENCGHRGDIHITKGIRLVGQWNSPDCPLCGCKHTLGRATPDRWDASMRAKEA